MPRVSVALACLALAASQGASAQLLTLGRGSLGGSLVGSGSQTAGLANPSAQDLRLWLDVPLKGSILHDDVFSYEFALKPTTLRRTQDDMPTSVSVQQLDLSFGARVLAAQPLSLWASGVRASTISSGGFGAERDARSSLVRSAVSWRNGWMPVQGSYSVRRYDETWRTIPTATSRRMANRQRMWQITAASSKTAITVRRLAFEDEIGAGTMSSLSALGQHVLRWGTGSRLETNLERLSQAGSIQSTRGMWSERLHLQHAKSISSDHTYRRSSTHVEGGASSSTSWNSGVTWTMTSWLSGGLQGGRAASRHGEGRSVAWQLGPRVGAAFRLSRGWSVTASTLVGVERRSSTVVGEPVSVVDEPHEVPPGRSFLLDRLDVVPGSIVVREGDGVALLLEGLDYRITPVGRSMRIDVPPGSRIEPGETVLVTYRFRPAGEPDVGSVRADYRIALRSRTVSVFADRSTRATQSLAPTGASPDGALPDFDEVRAGARAQVATPVGPLGLDAGLRHRGGQDAVTTTYDAAASWTPALGLPVETTAGLSWSRSRTDPVIVETWSGRAGLDWPARPDIRVRASTEGLMWRESGKSLQRFLSAMLAVDWSVVGFNLSLVAEHHWRHQLLRHRLNRVSLGFQRGY